MSDDARFEVRRLEPPRSGYGLWAKEDFRADVRLFEYKGETLTESQAAERYKRGDDGWPIVHPRYVLHLPRRGNIYLDASDPAKSNIARYINHGDSKKANVKFTETGSITSIKRIKAGQEIWANYGAEAVKYMRHKGELPPADSKKRKRPDTDGPTNNSSRVSGEETA